MYNKRNVTIYSIARSDRRMEIILLGHFHEFPAKC